MGALTITPAPPTLPSSGGTIQFNGVSTAGSSPITYFANGSVFHTAYLESDNITFYADFSFSANTTTSAQTYSIMAADRAGNQSNTVVISIPAPTQSGGQLPPPPLLTTEAFTSFSVVPDTATAINSDGNLTSAGGQISVSGAMSGVQVGQELELYINGNAYGVLTINQDGSTFDDEDSGLQIILPTNNLTTAVSYSVYVVTTDSLALASNTVDIIVDASSQNVIPPSGGGSGDSATLSIAFGTGTPTQLPYTGGGVTVTGTSTGIPAGATVTLWVVPPAGTATAIGEMTVGSSGGFNSTTFSIVVPANEAPTAINYAFYASYP